MANGDGPASNTAVVAIVVLVIVAIVLLLYYLRPGMSDMRTTPGIEAPASPAATSERSTTTTTPSSANPRR